uniref:Uncharacterized protein n=1 Tax=Rhizochromulina marina TaxID=1034831 RepID=A0A7S2SGU2_9STRA|mmetsp:Transcript_30020/g.87436  ORF Transcript_30020/g.87436 Transcript_30020/m.87436 type:complete len:360 (+) Transcript_30020:219-1298(+)
MGLRLESRRDRLPFIRHLIKLTVFLALVSSLLLFTEINLLRHIQGSLPLAVALAPLFLLAVSQIVAPVLCRAASPAKTLLAVSVAVQILILRWLSPSSRPMDWLLVVSPTVAGLGLLAGGLGLLVAAHFCRPGDSALTKCGGQTGTIALSTTQCRVAFLYIGGLVLSALAVLLFAMQQGRLESQASFHGPASTAWQGVPQGRKVAILVAAAIGFGLVLSGFYLATNEEARVLERFNGRHPPRTLAKDTVTGEWDLATERAKSLPPQGRGYGSPSPPRNASSVDHGEATVPNPQPHTGHPHHVLARHHWQCCSDPAHFLGPCAASLVAMDLTNDGADTAGAAPNIVGTRGPLGIGGVIRV